MNVDIGKLYNGLESVEPGQGEFGWLPSMASSSVGQLCALSAESYCERVLSCANNVVTKGNTLLSDPEVEMACVLRVNRPFMEYMRENYNSESRRRSSRARSSTRRKLSSSSSTSRC